MIKKTITNRHYVQSTTKHFEAAAKENLRPTKENPNVEYL